MPILLACLLASLAPAVSHGAEDTDIAFAATVTVSPQPVPGTLARILDGNVRTGLTFEVGTGGGAVLEFAFDTPRVVSGVRFYQSSPIY